MTQFLKNAWFFLRWGLLLAVLGTVVAWPYLSNRLDEEIRCRVLEKFTANYQGLTVAVHSAQLIKGEGIRIRGVSIREPGVEGPTGELALYEEIFLTCPTGVADLLQDELPMQKITVRRLTVRATLGKDGQWNAMKLWPLPHFSKKCADAIVVENSTLELIDPTGSSPRKLVVRDINLSLTPHDGNSDTPACDRTMEVRGSFAAEHVQRVELAGLMAPHASGWAITGSVSGLSACPELFHCMPCTLADKMASAISIRGEADATFQVRYAADQQPPLQFQVAGKLSQGRIDDPLLPYPLTDLQIVAHANNQGATLDQLSARHGDTSIHLTAKTDGFRPTSKIEIEGQARRLTLDRRGAEALPENLRAQWKKFEPAGEIDADFKATFDGQRWRPDAVVNCLDVSFSYYKFPYRLERGTGTLELHDDHATIHMTAFGGGQPLRLDGEFMHPGPDFTGELNMRGKDLPFDENLFAAMPENSREAIRSLNPRGTFHVVTKSWRDDPKDPNMHHQMSVYLNHCSMQFDKFPYPLAHIHGTLEMRDHHWTFNDLEGSNATGIVKCKGQLVPTGNGYDLTVHLDGAEVPLEEQLRDALKPNMQKLWNDLRPRGALNLAIDVHYLTAKKQFDLAISGEPSGDGASLEPTFFPYRIEHVKGGFSYRDGHADFKNVRAVHGRVSLASQGSIDFQPDGNWRFRLKDLSVDRLRADRDLLAALPPKLKKIVGQLNPTGPINMHGTVELAGIARPDVPVTSAWDLEFNMLQGNVDCGVKLDNVFGGIRLTGVNDGRHTQCRGELAVDAVTYKDFQLTEVLGPLWIDDERILLGSGAQQSTPGTQPRRLTAKLYGGTISADCAVALGVTPQYTVQAAIADGDLSRFVKESVAGQNKLKGKVYGNIQLAGTTQGVHTLTGKGQIQLRDADIYELPVMVAMLKILSIRPPDKTAFTTSDMAFRMEGDHIYFDKIEFAGDAVSLLGKGEMDFESDLHMVFHSVVGRSDYQIPFVKNILGSASQQIMLIHVDGTLAHPNTRTEAFPGVNQALQSLQIDRPVTPEARLPGRENR